MEVFEGANLAGGFGATSIGRPRGEGWLEAAALVAPGSPALAERLEALREAWMLDARAAAAFLVYSYTKAIASPAIYCFAGSGRVPDISAANLAVRFDGDGLAAEVALAAPRFAADERDPLLCLRKRMLDTNLVPLLDGLLERKLLGRRALWGNVVDTCARAFCRAADHFGELERLLAHGRTFLELVDARSGAATAMVVAEHAGRRLPVVRRGVCCLGYRSARLGYCGDCPLLPSADRAHRVRLAIEARG